MKEITNRKLWGRIAEVYGTQSAFAKAIGVSKQAVSKALAGCSSMSRNKIEEWSIALGIPKEEIGNYFF